MGNHRTILAGFWVALAMLSLLQTGCAQRFTRMSDRQPVGFDQMVAEIKGARVVFIGETHDVEEHHEMQLDIIRALHGAGIPLAIGLEMFPAKSQGDLDQWVEGRLDTGSFRWIFGEIWRIEWWLYSDIFFYARDNRIPLIGLNIPKEVMRKVYMKGFASLSAEEREGLPPDIACDSADPYTGMIQRAYTGHSADSGSFVNFCEAQTLWNRGMALHLANYLEKNPDRTVVVLAGGGHAIKRGIPGQLKRYGDFSSRVIIPEITGLFAAGVSVLDADYYVE